MNPRLGLLQPYPFERLRELLHGVTPPAHLRPISLGLGEPQHPTPQLLKDALTANLSGLSRYPLTLVVAPNPFYQIYEGAALLGGAHPYYVNSLPQNGLRADWQSVPDSVWQRVRLVYTCSPSNPHGRVMALEEWKLLFDLADRHGFV